MSFLSGTGFYGLSVLVLVPYVRTPSNVQGGLLVAFVPFVEGTPHREFVFVENKTTFASPQMSFVHVTRVENRPELKLERG
jgi:hypothetical protein